MATPQKKDPNKYAKNADIQADTPLKTALSVIGMGLMLVGILGIAVDFFKDDGFFKDALGWLFDSTQHMMLIPVIALVGWFLNKMMSSTNPNESKKSGNIPMYAMMVVGIFYIYRFITTGGF
jgi:hypothetical protein